MRSSTIFSASLLIAVAQAASKFGLVIIRSGSELQYSLLTMAGDKLVAGGNGTEFEGTWQADDSITFGNKFLGADSVSDLALVGDNAATFSNSDGYLAYKGSESFTAVPGDNGVYWIRIGEFPGATATPVALEIVELGDDTDTTSTSSHNDCATKTTHHQTAVTTKCEPRYHNSTVHVTSTYAHSRACNTSTPIVTPVNNSTQSVRPTPVQTTIDQVNGAGQKAACGAAIIAGLVAALL